MSLGYEEAMKLVACIQEIAHGGGYRDDEALREIEHITNQLSWERIPGADEKLISINGWSKILFSPRKHQQWGGPERVRSFIFQDCTSLEMIISRTFPKDQRNPCWLRDYENSL